MLPALLGALVRKYTIKCLEKVNGFVLRNKYTIAVNAVCNMLETLLYSQPSDAKTLTISVAFITRRIFIFVHSYFSYGLLSD